MKAPARYEIVLGFVGGVLGFAFGSMDRGATPPPSPGKAPDAAPAPVITTSNASAEAISEAIGALLERGNFRELARLGTLLDALDSAQMRELLARLDQLPPSERELFLRRLLAYWTKRDPQAATDWMQPRLARYATDRQFANGFANFDTDLVHAWADNAPALAIEYARAHPGTGLSRTILHAAIFAWPDKDFGHRFELLRAFPAGSDRQKVTVSLCFTWAQMDRPAALAAVSSLPPGAERDHALGEVLARHAGHDPTVAFKEAERLGIHDSGVLSVVVKEAAKSHPAAAAQWVATQDAALIADLGVVVATFWAEDDPAAAFAWALEHKISLTDNTSKSAAKIPRDMFAGHAAEMRVGESPFSAALNAKPDETLAWARSLPAGPERDRYLELVARDGTHAR